MFRSDEERRTGRPLPLIAVKLPVERKALR